MSLADLHGLRIPRSRVSESLHPQVGTPPKVICPPGRQPPGDAERARGLHGAGAPSKDWTPHPSLQRINVQFNNGEHGFDNKDLDMKTIFRAVGPSFKEGLEVAPFESVHVYELMCQLLGIVPEPNDGDPDTLKPMLRSSGGGPPSPAPSTGGPPSPAPSTDPGWHGHTELPSGSALLPKGRPPLMSALLGTLTLLAKVT
ncbi:hypothetical protein GHT09_017453 [Marmota monax]|uniref:Uncharacterized protein n=1 Tax=Marmota monax TaxID=9995 RepID=A0A834Q1Y5_MARMO|nr:hypothetical protein GHT09_017453 [Marmota monax]